MGAWVQDGQAPSRSLELDDWRLGAGAIYRDLHAQVLSVEDVGRQLLRRDIFGYALPIENNALLSEVQGGDGGDVVGESPLHVARLVTSFT